VQGAVSVCLLSALTVIHDRFSIAVTHRVPQSTEPTLGRIAKHCAKLYEELQSVLGLCHLMKQKLSDYGSFQVFEELEMPLSCLLARMEFEGLCVSLTTLQAISDHASTEIKALEREAHHAAGQDFNLSSPEQVAHLLFDTLGLVARGQTADRTKKHQSTSEDTLLLLVDQHPVVALILEYRSSLPPPRLASPHLSS
jgi:DNA polymerase I-like protein with 3'-5' exonuclease and polymerase domains